MVKREITNLRLMEYILFVLVTYLPGRLRAVIESHFINSVGGITVKYDGSAM